MKPPSSRRRLSHGKQPTLLPRQSQHPPAGALASVGHQRSERGRKNVSRACQECRQRRIKCTNWRPCQPCQGNGLQCVDDTGPEGVDLRTIRAGQDSHRQLLHHRESLNSLIRHIRIDDADTQALLAWIRAGATLEQITALLGSGSISSSAGHISDDLSEQSERADGITSPLTIEKGQPGSKRRRDRRQFIASPHSGTLPLSSGVRANHFASGVQDRQIGNLSKPIWACLPLIDEEFSIGDAFSRSIFSFWSLARKQMADGAPAKLILSSDGVELDLLFRDRTIDDPHTVSTWACELLKTFTFLPPVVKMAAVEAVACLMRWLVAPTQQHYSDLPPSSRPIESQLFVPHSIGVDIIYLPEIRDSLLTRVGRDWVSNVTPTTLDYHWPYSDDACLEPRSVNPDGSASPVRLSKAFLEHIRDSSNVSIDRRMLSVFPEFEGTLRLHDPLESPDLEDVVEVEGDGVVDGAAEETEPATLIDHIGTA